jgi:hypothetical protein
MIVHKRDQAQAEMASCPGSSDHKVAEKEWRSLWSVKVPSKINMFLWRLACHSLPTSDVRHHRHMADSSACFFCGQQDSWRHSLIDCNVAKCVWALEDEQIASMISSGDESNAKVRIAQTFKSLNNDEAARVAVVLWAIWFTRQKAIHESVFQSPLSTHGFIQRFMADLEGVSQHRAQGQPKQGKEPAQI